MKRDLQGQYITLSMVGEKVRAFVPSPLPHGKTCCLFKLTAREDTAFSCNNKHLPEAAGRYKHCQQVNRPKTQSTLCLFPVYQRYKSRNWVVIVTFLSHSHLFSVLHTPDRKFMILWIDIKRNIKVKSWLDHLFLNACSLWDKAYPFFSD